MFGRCCSLDRSEKALPPLSTHVCSTEGRLGPWPAHLLQPSLRRQMCMQKSSSPSGDGSGMLIPQKGHYGSKLKDTYTFQPHWKARSGKKEVKCQQQRHRPPWATWENIPGEIFNLQVLLKPRGTRKGFGCRRLVRLYAKRRGKSYEGEPCQSEGQQESARNCVGQSRSNPATLCFRKRQYVQWLKPRPPENICPGENRNSSIYQLFDFNKGLFPLLKAATTTVYTHYGSRRRTKRVNISSSKQAKWFRGVWSEPDLPHRKASLLFL